MTTENTNRVYNAEEQHKPGSDRFMFDTFLIKEFFDAVKEGNLEKIKNYIDVKYLKDTHLSHNALFYASLIKDDSNAINIMKFFVDLGIDPLFKDNINQTVLYYACREGKTQCVKYLVELGCPINEKDLYLQTPIFYAAREGKMEIIEFLVDKGSELNIEDKFGQNCLFYAIKDGHADVVEYLVKKGVNINKVDKKKLTPLTFAYKNSKNNIAELLLELGAQEVKDVGNDKKKAAKKKGSATGNNDSEKGEETKVENKIRKYVLVRIVEGEKKVLNSKEMEEFKKKFPDVAELLYNQKLIEDLEQNAPEALKSVDSWEKLAKKLMQVLWKVKDSELFHRPVDPIELGIPDYTDIIKKPMDFTTIKKKLNGNIYTNCKEFVDDMDLVFSNCVLYNGESSVIGLICNNVKNEYKKLFEQVNLGVFL